MTVIKDLTLTYHYLTLDVVLVLSCNTVFMAVTGGGVAEQRPLLATLGVKTGEWPPL